MSSEMEESELGQFIPLHYHFHMLKDPPRMEPFKEAIERVTKDGSTVLELGGGTGVLSWFAAQKARKVYCVERNPEMVAVAKKFLPNNPNGDRVEVIEADAAKYVPPEPVDLVICEMIHTGMIREKQMEVMIAFKENYKKRFPLSPVPRLMPEAAIQAIQPLQENYIFYGYHAPVPLFQEAYAANPDSLELGDPVVYQMLDFRSSYGLDIYWNGTVTIQKAGTLNALRVILKNLLAIVPEENRSIDWHCRYIVMPLDKPVPVEPGMTFDLELKYRAGCSMAAFHRGIRIARRH